MRYLQKLSLLAATALIGTQLAVCDPLYSFASVNQTNSDDPLSLGFVFTANTSFEVDSLGWYDATGNGFATSHTVGLFDANGNLLTSATLASGAGDPLNGGFRYQSITPVTLTAGAAYTLAGTSGSEDRWTTNDQANGFAVNSAFTIGPDAARFTYSSTLVDPTSHFSDYVVYAGPNLDGQVPSSATPEPASLFLVALAAAPLFLARKLRRSQS